VTLASYTLLHTPAIERRLAREACDNEDDRPGSTSSDNVPRSQDGEQKQFCLPRLLSTKRVPFCVTIILIFAVSTSRFVGGLAKRQFLYDRIKMEDIPFEMFCNYQNRVDAV
jgi:hypothetical protein